MSEKIQSSDVLPKLQSSFTQYSAAQTSAIEEIGKSITSIFISIYFMCPFILDQNIYQSLYTRYVK